MPQSKQIYILSDKKVEGAINLPMIEIQYIEQSINIQNYDALIFTSKNAVKAMDSMDESWKSIPSYVIAPQTAQTLQSLGGNLVFTGKQNHGNEFAHEIQKELQDKRVLYIRGVKMVSSLLDILSSKNVNCDSLIVYDTVCKIYEEEVLLPKNSIIIFSAPSTIECFLKNVTWDESFQAICIGKTTAEYFPPYIKPIVSDTTSLASCVEKARELS